MAQKQNAAPDQVTKLAFRIADKSALLDIEGFTRKVTVSRKEYQDVSIGEDIDEVVQYCELRGLIRHHPTRTELVLLLWDHQKKLAAR